MSQSVLVADEQSLISTAEKISAGTLYDVSVKPRASLLGTRADRATKVGSKVAKVSYRVIKRGSDILFGFIGCLFVFPIAVFVKLAYVVTGDLGSIFYSQERIGKNGKSFGFYKFRSMKKNADELLEELLKDPKIKTEWETYRKLDNDPRVTKIGKILRKTSLDEFPQFFNILKGDMSLIGPRPLMPGELDEHYGNHEVYESVRPGLTGWWAANGRSETDYDERLEQEYYYVKNCSLGLDLLCVFKTAKGVLKLEGAK